MVRGKRTNGFQSAVQRHFFTVSTGIQCICSPHDRQLTLGVIVLRKADNVSISHRRGFWTRKGPIVLRIGKQTYEAGRMPALEYEERQQRQLKRPVAMIRVEDRTYWRFENRSYWEDENLTSNQVYALLRTRELRRQQQIELAESTISKVNQPQKASPRRRIPDDVKQNVWIRDEGRCQNCGATTDLQFDHVIPLAMNGSNNAANLQLLCGSCNRRKSAGLTLRS